MGPEDIVPATKREAEFILAVLEGWRSSRGTKVTDLEQRAEERQFERSLHTDAGVLSLRDDVSLPPGYAITYLERGGDTYYAVRIPRALRCDNDALLVTEQTLPAIAHAWNHFLLRLPTGLTQIDVEEAAESSHHERESIWALLWNLVLFRHTSVIAMTICDRGNPDGPRPVEQSPTLEMTAGAIENAATRAAMSAVASLRTKFLLPDLPPRGPDRADLDPIQLVWLGFLLSFASADERNDAARWFRLAEARVASAVEDPNRRVLIQEATRAWASAALMCAAAAQHNAALAHKEEDPKVRAGLNERAEINWINTTSACRAIDVLGLGPTRSMSVVATLRWARRHIKENSPRLDAVLKKTFAKWSARFDEEAARGPNEAGA